MGEVGHPTDYDEAYIEQAEKLCLLGATDDEIADFFGVSTRTIYRWKNAHPEFSQALKNGKELADERVERSLYQRATGFHFVEQQAFKVKSSKDAEEVHVVDVELFSPPDTTAAIFWLKNRRPKAWRDKTEVALEAGDSLVQLLAKIASNGAKLVDLDEDEPPMIEAHVRQDG